MLALSPAYRPLRGNFMRALFIQTRTLNVSARRLRRILIAFIVATLASGAIAPAAHAAIYPPDGTYNCLTGLASVVTPTFDITTGVVSNGGACAGAVVIPSGVISFGVNAFRLATGLTSIVIPSSVQSIGDHSFRETTGLNSITFAPGSRLVSIGYAAFYQDTQLTSIIIPSGVTFIDQFAFAATNPLTTFTYCGSAALVGTGLDAKIRICPGAPTIGTATATGATTATVAFTAPGDDGGSIITSYIATSSPGSITTTLTQAGSGTISITGLSATTAYTFTVVAYNARGQSLVSSASNSVTTTSPTTVPGAPTIGSATTTGTTTVSVSFTAPGSDGGSTILSYTATSTPGSITATLTQAGSGTISVTGLSPTTSYTFTVIAHNAIGNSVASSASNAVTTSTPTTAPGAPTIGTASSTGTTTATVSFAAPGSDGGSTILYYVATSSPGSITARLSQSGSGTISVTGLSPTTSYTFTIIAHNAIGDSLASSVSNSITTATPVLSAPISVTVTGLNAAQIQVAFTAPASNGGSVVTSYTITSVPAKVSATLYQSAGGSVIFSGLEGGTNYTFSVIAHTALADSPETISSSGVIMPAYIPIPQMLPTIAPQLSSNGESLRCSAGGYSQLPSASIFSLFVGGIYVSTNFSAGGAFLPDWIIDWATPGTISRTATLQDAIWKIDPSWAGKKVSCRTVGYANNAIGITDSKALRL